jgi:hypothetical protein
MSVYMIVLVRIGMYGIICMYFTSTYMQYIPCLLQYIHICIPKKNAKKALYCYYNNNIVITITIVLLQYNTILVKCIRVCIC